MKLPMTDAEKLEEAANALDTFDRIVPELVRLLIDLASSIDPATAEKMEKYLDGVNEYCGGTEVQEFLRLMAHRMMPEWECTTLSCSQGKFVSKHPFCPCCQKEGRHAE